MVLQDLIQSYCELSIMKVARLYGLKHFYKPSQFLHIKVEIKLTAPFRPRVPAGYSARIGAAVCPAGAVRLCSW